GAEDRPVAAEHEHEIDRCGDGVARERRLVVEAGELGGLHLEDRLDAPLVEPVRDGGQVRGGGGQALLGDDPDAHDSRCRSFRHHWFPLRRCSRYSWLPVAPVIGDGVLPMGTNPTARAAADTSSITRACTAGSRTRPPRSTSARPASNCGLTSAMT